MALHDDVAELVARAGAAVLEDAVDFRAAFDDFVPEGLATEGELNLLMDAIRLGALRRIVEQIDHGADPVTAVDLQAVRLAQQRGTQEVDGARWALAVLAFAQGKVPAQAVPLGKPSPPELSAHPPPSGGTAAAAPGTAALAAPAPLAPTAPAAPRVTARSGGAEPTGGRRPRRGVVGAVLLVVLVAAAATLALVLRHEDGSPDPGDDAASSTTETSRLVAGTVVATDDVAPLPAAARVVMASRITGVRVAAFSEVDSIGEGEAARKPEDGDRIVAFTLADGPCQERPSCSWRPGQLSVLIGADEVSLPGSGPTFAAVAPVDATVFLTFAADGVDQRVNLADGTAGKDNIAVLARTRRTVEVDGSATIQPVPSIVGDVDPWAVTIGRAELFYFDGQGRGPGRVDEAFLRIEATYTNGGAPQRFHFGELRLEDSRGRLLEARNAGTKDKPITVFVVPADFTRGTLVVGGSRVVPYNGSSYVLTIPEKPFPVRF